jgi:HSP20 family protein
MRVMWASQPLAAPPFFQRSLRLPDTVDEDKVEASFNNGVLKVSLPKRPEAIGKQRTIPIKKG